jgi:biotin-(acetyl-CoA carboxylase) ligase
MCRFLRDAHGLPVLVKWPNDLMLHGRKIAGMLTEARVDSEATRDLVFGMGLNVNSSESDFPPELTSVASSLSLNIGHALNLSRLAHSVILHLAEAIQDFLDGQFPMSWRVYGRNTISCAGNASRRSSPKGRSSELLPMAPCAWSGMTDQSLSSIVARCP